MTFSERERYAAGPNPEILVLRGSRIHGHLGRFVREVREQRGQVYVGEPLRLRLVV